MISDLSNNVQRQGYRAFKKGIERGPKDRLVQISNPYKDYERSRDWQFGYDRAYFDNRDRIST